MHLNDPAHGVQQRIMKDLRTCHCDPRKLVTQSCQAADCSVLDGATPPEQPAAAPARQTGRLRNANGRRAKHKDDICAPCTYRHDDSTRRQIALCDDAAQASLRCKRNTFQAASAHSSAKSFPHRRPPVAPANLWG